ncbi:MAG: c-type cytochrome biogenesis protein CcmI [Alphaproteobacteria bacterium]|nr:c-type cytochrome biogenesis protein CcmI [Alphaproteobacteria bacterium]MBU2379148.1 c-type cytochrome biogenesis protein CcmI [Alphaproteobacteria bacterium]
MIVFWTLAGLATAMAGLLVLSFARAGAERSQPASDTGAAELAELDRLKARGLLDDDAYASARAEAGRRLLATPDAVEAPVVGGRDRTVVLAALVAAAAAALGLYFVFGEPGLEDQSYERRIDAWADSPETLDAPQIAAVLGRAVRREPDNRTALTMLGAARFEAGDPIGAASAFRRALALDPDDATSWARLGESLVRANEGSVGGDAEAAFVRALEIDPEQLGARFFLGEAALARGDAARAREMWTPLIAALDPADPRRADLVARLDAAA